MKYKFLILTLLAGLLFGCKDTSVNPGADAFGYDYYPVAVGDYHIYNVTDIKFKNNVGDTSRYQMREVIDTVLTDQTNTLNYKIVRATRPDEDAVWVEDSVLVVSKSSTSLILTQNNTKYVKLIFPVKEGMVWLGDAYNNHIINELEQDPVKRKEPYRYADVGKPFTIGGKTFEQTATVVQGMPTDNLVQLDNRKEVYASKIGRVYRLFNRVVYCNDSESKECPFGEEYKLDGHERHEVLISFGHK